MGIVACGDYANAMFAFGNSSGVNFLTSLKTKANGTIYECLQNLSSANKQAVIEEMYRQVPIIYHWIIKMVSGLL